MATNTSGTIIRVREVWQTDQDRRPADKSNCLRGLITRRDFATGEVFRPACTGINCMHD